MQRNNFWIIAGGINLLTALLHTFGGQLDLVNPLLNSELLDQTKAEWVGGWHMITIVLFLSSYVLLRNGIKASFSQSESIRLIGILYLLFSFPSIIASIVFGVFAPQFVLLLPVGFFALYGVKRQMID